jgi:hypothetical protein
MDRAEVRGRAGSPSTQSLQLTAQRAQTMRGGHRRACAVQVLVSMTDTIRTLLRASSCAPVRAPDGSKNLRDLPSIDRKIPNAHKAVR